MAMIKKILPKLLRRENLTQEEAESAMTDIMGGTATPAQIEKVAARARGFIYLVSVAGITGERASLPEGLGEFVARVRQHAKAPVAVGFGISTPAQAAEVGKIADGVIIGSAVITAAGGEAPVEGVREFVRTVRGALR